MNDIKITVELCAEDRARLDTIIEKLGDLGKRPDCSACAKGVAEYVSTTTAKAPMEWDDLQKKLAEALVKAKMTDTIVKPAETPQDAPTAEEHPTLDPFPEVTPAAEEPSEAVAEEPKPEVTIEMLKSKVITLAAKDGMKDKVRELVRSYAMKVTDIPADKWAEVYAKLDELGGEKK